MSRATPPDRSAAFDRTQVHILEMIARGDPIEHSLQELCARIERLVPASVAGVTVLDRAARTFEAAIFPSLPPTYASAIPGLRVADKPGSCAFAIYHGETVTSLDIAADNRFQTDWCTLNLGHGLRSIQSRPVFAPDGTSLGTFVVGFRELRSAEMFEAEAIALGAHLAGIALARHRMDQKKDLLIAELRHRTKNLFSSIGALAHFTLRANPDPDDFRKALDGRIGALAAAHSLALEGRATDLRSLLLAIFAPYDCAERIALEGPAIELSSDATVAFALALHELATNALKYGALASKAGHIAVTWDARQQRDQGCVFHLRWTESGGPPAPQVGKAGFGRKAVEQSLAQSIDGLVKLDFAPAGLTCTIEAPLTERLGTLTGTVLAAE